ncbi:FmdB family zinc ribbon protein [Candidatus Methylocalor cossyra]|uniref:FmdB family regulatory protein n=1 Tax=Candidatus Methylocalor cossyra TaxID=3108543 RepID=A0ABM9NIP4_9GAMM
MPIYDYHCKHCGKEFELLVSHSARPVCPECGQPDLEKRPSLTAPQGKSAALIAKARAQAAKEGHFSNYSAAERARLKV